MGDDLNIIVPPVEEEEEQSVDEIGQELVDLLSSCMNRIDNLVLQVGEQNARIAGLEERLAEYSGRVWAEVGHTHEEFAPIGHSHPEYALVEHAHEEEHQERDTAPENQHIWFRKWGT
jgi:hypothetical protein